MLHSTPEYSLFCNYNFDLTVFPLDELSILRRCIGPHSGLASFHVTIIYFHNHFLCHHHIAKQLLITLWAVISSKKLVCAPVFFCTLQSTVLLFSFCIWCCCEHCAKLTTNGVDSACFFLTRCVRQEACEIIEMMCLWSVEVFGGNVTEIKPINLLLQLRKKM